MPDISGLSSFGDAAMRYHGKINIMQKKYGTALRMQPIKGRRPWTNSRRDPPG
jgi:hypothetical protein